MKPLAVRFCDYCGKKVLIYHRKRLEYNNIYCSHKCESLHRKSLVRPNVKCAYCGKEFYCQPHHLKKTKNPCCSKQCSILLRKITYKGENNPQYGLKGNLNASWKSDIKITNYGYRKIRVLDHPFHDCDGFVFEHRLVAEQYLLTPENSIEYNGKYYLNPELIVHHINENKLDNRVENLCVCTIGEHTKHHTKFRQHANNKKREKSKKEPKINQLNQYDIIPRHYAVRVYKHVKQYNTQYQYLRTFYTLKEAALYVNGDSSSIGKACRKQGYHKTAYGYIWEYESR